MSLSEAHIRGCYRNKRRRGAPKHRKPTEEESLRKWVETRNIAVQGDSWHVVCAEARAAIHEDDGCMHGFKVVSADMLGYKNTKFEIGKWYTESRKPHIAKNGYHFVLQPLFALQAMALWIHTLRGPLRVLKIRAKGIIKTNGRISVAERLQIVGEVPNPGKVLTGVAVARTIANHFQDGKECSPIPGEVSSRVTSDQKIQMYTQLAHARDPPKTCVIDGTPRGGRLRVPKSGVGDRVLKFVL